MAKLVAMTVRQLFVFLLFIAWLAMGVRETLDPDMWWHLRTGEWIAENGLPRHDPFSYTFQGEPWTAHEWLSDLLMWVVFRAGGLPALILLFAGITAVAHWLIFQRCDGRPYLAGFVVLLATLASAPFWGVRPQMFNVLLTAVFIFVVEGYRRGQYGWRPLWLLPPLTVLWANLHSGYLLGIVLLATYTGGELLGRWRAGPTMRSGWTKGGWLAAAAAGCFLAALVNPQGYRLWIYPFETLGSPVMQRYIFEWRSPDFHMPVMWSFAVLLAVVVLSWLASGERPLPTELLLYTGTGAAGLLSARHIPLFALVAAPIAARHLALAATQRGWSLLGGTGDTPAATPGQRRLNLGLATAGMLALTLYAGQLITGNDDAMAVRYPVAAVDYLEETGQMNRRLFNEYAWGGYLIWRGLPVFVDGRADLYGDAFLLSYRQTYGLLPDWAAPLDRHDVEMVVIPRSAPLSALLSESVAWEPLYEDDVARIFVRRSSGP